MATKVNMNLLNPSVSRIQIPMQRNRATHQMLLQKQSNFLTMSRNTPRTIVQKMDIVTNPRSSLVMKKSRGCSSCGGR